MINLSVSRSLQICGGIWVAAGFILLRKGLMFASNLANQTEGLVASGLFGKLISWFGDTERAALAIVVSGFIVGFLKARMVFSKVVLRQALRLQAMKQVRVTQLFDLKFILVIALMMMLGLSLNLLQVVTDLRAWIDITVGTALIQGASFYFRAARCSFAQSQQQ